MSLNLAHRLSYKSTHSSDSMSPLQQHALEDIHSCNSSIQFLSKGQSIHFDCFIFKLHPHTMKNSFIFIYKHDISRQIAHHTNPEMLYVEEKRQGCSHSENQDRYLGYLTTVREINYFQVSGSFVVLFIHCFFVIRIDLFCMKYILTSFCKYDTMLKMKLHIFKDAEQRRKITMMLRKSRSVSRLSNDGDGDELFSSKRILFILRSSVSLY